MIRPKIEYYDLDKIIAEAPMKKGKNILEKKVKEEDLGEESKTLQKSRIINFDKFWTIEGVNYNNKIGVYELSKELIPSATHDELAALSKESKEKGGFYCPDARLFYSILSAVKDSGNTDVRDFIQEKLRKNWLNTLTRIKHFPRKKDEVIHNYKMSDEYSVKGDIVGKDGQIKDVSPKSYLELLLGEKDAGKINNVFQFINKTDCYIWRLNSKPNKLDERVAWFNAGSDRANLNCDGYSSNRNSSLGVRAVGTNKVLLAGEIK